MQNQVINLVSDTGTLPTPSMKAAMMSAPLGDDVFGTDPTVNALEEKVANLFRKEAAIFCPSGTMTNQIAIKLHTQPLDELICDINSHVYQYETAGYAFNSGVGVKLLEGINGKITAPQIEAAINARYDWLPTSTLVVLENSCNKGGGSYYTCEEIRPITDLCKEKKLALHLDGARIFNVLVETGEKTEDVGNLFDSISICLSKGLGAPIGSLLIGTKAYISQARRFRKVMGGGMRQSGIIAAAGIYALDHHVERLKEDNYHAKMIGRSLEKQPYVSNVRPVKTNIVIFDLGEGWTAETFLKKLEEYNIKASAFGPKTVRFVTHLDVTEGMIQKVIEVLDKIKL